MEVLKKPILQLIKHSDSADLNVDLYMLRDDLNHVQIQGNKWRKLKYNLIAAKSSMYTHLITFGGVYSNHIAASAAAAKLLGFTSLGIVRGDESQNITETLRFARECGMKLHFASRSRYRELTKASVEEIQSEFGNGYVLPEGGTNTLALKGVAELINSISIDYHMISVPCGTGGTLAGVLSATNKKVVGFSSMKGEDTMTSYVEDLLIDSGVDLKNNVEINREYHFGGYARMNHELLNFIKEFYQINQILLDPIYTGKMMYGLIDQIKSGRIGKGETIIAIHTGGLQGWCGYQDEFKNVTGKEFAYNFNWG